jgi:hypothetical protein
MNKRGQLTIFVILGILILAVAITFILISVEKGNEEKNKLINTDQKTDVGLFVEDCVKLAVDESISKILKHGGETEKRGPFLTHNFEDINYLCHTPEYSENCVNLEPLLIPHVEKEISEDSIKKVESCFNRLENLYSTFKVSKGDLKYEIAILPGRVNVLLKKEIKIKKDNTELTYEDFSFEFNSPLDTFLTITTEVINLEATCNCLQENCAENYLNLNRFYQNFITTRETTSTGEKVYTIEYLGGKMQFDFAVRNCIRDYE